MRTERFLIVGSGGRESAFALKLAAEESIALYAVISHPNPNIIDCVEQTGGEYLLANESDPEIVSAFAKKHAIDYAFVNSDTPLAKGVVDALLEKNIKAIGGTQAATRIEWDKIYSIEMMRDIAPEYTPYFKIVNRPDDLAAAIDYFEKRKLQVVVKPQGLTGGKGVKVMPEHLKSYQDCIDYAKDLFVLRPKERVLLVEKLNGIEFTIMGFTDGNNLVLSPASYDYPFRHENDTGPGTGGMGCFTNSEKKLPFMNDQDLEDCKTIMEEVIKEIKHRGLSFKGVLNGGFFKTAQGIKFMEFNGRFGDPEGLNILLILESSFSRLLKDLWHGTLSENSVKFTNRASVIKYLVAREYPNPSDQPYNFSIDKTKIEKQSVRLFFASCKKQAEGEYITLKTSRVLAFGAIADSINEASDKINLAIKDSITSNFLEFRSDIGSKESLQKLAAVAANLK